MPTPIFLALTLLLEPDPAPAEVSCSDVAALLDLGDRDRTTFEALCASTVVAQDEREQLQLSLDRLLRVGDWRATLAMRTLAEPTTVTVTRDAIHNPALEVTEPVPLDLHGKFRQCAALGTAITQFVEDLDADRFPRQVGLEILRNDPTCAKQFQGLEHELDALISSHVLITYVGEPKDHASALVLDPNSPRLVGSSPVFEHPRHPGLQFLLVPRGQRVLMFVHQVEHDIAWTATRIYNRNATLARHSEIACIDAKLTLDEGVDAAILVDGQILGGRLIERREEQRGRQRTVINVPAGEHDILMVLHGANDEDHVRELSIPEAIEARLSVERRVSTTADSRTTLEHDFHGLRSGQNRYGIARITVDEQCEAAGLWSPRVRQHIEQYTRLLDAKGVRLEQLDAWSDALAEFQLLQQGKSSSEAMFDDRKRTGELAETVMRQGVDFLLFFELRCDAEGDGVDVFGTSIDLRTFSLTAKAGEVETRGLRDSRLHTAPRARAREAIEVVLGDLFGVGHVAVTTAPTGNRDTRRHIAVTAEYPAAEAPSLEVAVFRVPSRDICNRIESINSLAHDTNLDDLRTAIVGANSKGGSKKGSKKKSKPKAREEWVLFGPQRVAVPSEAPHGDRMATWNEEFDIAGLPSGTYVVWIADSEAQRYDARCFEVDERTFEYWLAVSAGTRTRGGDPRFNPRYDQVSHLRLTSGLRVHSRRYFAAGALLGYEHVVYDASTTPSWDDFDDTEYESDGTVSLDYARNGLLIGAFAGFELPFCLASRVRQNAGCKGFTRRLAWFIEGAMLGNLGFLDLGSLPEGLAAEASAFDPDLDLTLQTGVRILATSTARFGIILGSHWTDVTAVAANTRLPAGQPHAAAALTFDYAWRWTLGFELSLSSRRTR